MSVTIDDLAAELGADPHLVAATARELITSGDQKVLTLEPAPGDGIDPVACLTDHAAAAIRTRLGSA